MSPKTTYPKLFLVRHGETAWTISGKHTGLTDIPLTENGTHQAKQLSLRLKKEQFSHVFSSPLQRARSTCELCGFKPILDSDLVEWDYGDYEGLTSKEIAQKDPSWNLFTQKTPGGETLEAVGKRADHFLAKLRKLKGDIALFSSGHILRVLAARFLELPPENGRQWILSPASLSILGHEHGNPVLMLWNDTGHLSQDL